MSKVVFVLDKIDNGGLQKVNAEIANILRSCLKSLK